MLRLESVSKTYGNGTEALRPLSLEIGEGEFVAILGRSGSGKSTLLRCINRLVEPSSGKIFLREDEITGAGPARLRQLRSRIGMIFQDYNLVPRVSVLTNVLSGCLGHTPSLAGLINHFPAEDIERAYQNLERLEIADKAHHRADRLSGGQQQRVGIARALMQRPRLILADEPLSSLDPATARSILKLLQDIHRQDGVTVLCNLHVPELALEYGTRIIALKSGQLFYDGPPESLGEETIGELYASHPVI